MWLISIAILIAGSTRLFVIAYTTWKVRVIVKSGASSRRSGGGALGNIHLVTYSKGTKNARSGEKLAFRLIVAS